MAPFVNTETRDQKRLLKIILLCFLLTEATNKGLADQWGTNETYY